MLAWSLFEGQVGIITIKEATGHDLRYMIAALLMGPESPNPPVLPSETSSPFYSGRDCDQNEEHPSNRSILCLWPGFVFLFF